MTTTATEAMEQPQAPSNRARTARPAAAEDLAIQVNTKRRVPAV